MTNKDIYKMWAPTGKKWVDWVRPVPFIAIDDSIKKHQANKPVLPCLSFLDENKDVAIIVDMPDTDSVEAGILIAQEYGYRPIPIYNGVMETKGSKATSDNRSVLDALVWGAFALQGITIKDDALPVFLTDTNRLRIKTKKTDVSVFDNSWDVYPQDIPSENYFLNNGISKILVIGGGKKLAKDLKAIFKDYPKKQVEIYWSNGYDEPKLVQKRKELKK